MEQHVARLSAAVGFWAAAVIFVAAVATVAGWVPQAGVAAGIDPDAPALPATEAPAGPHEVVLDGGGLVTFPMPSERSEQLIDVSGEQVTLILYDASEGDVTYSLGVIEYPDSVSLADPAVNLIASVSGAANNVGGRVATQEITTYEGLPAVQFEVEAGAVRLVARNVLVGRRLYLQNVAFPTTGTPAAVDDFFDSLEPPPP